MKVIDHAPGDKHKRVVVGRWVWLAPPLDRLQEGLTFGVDPLIIGGVTITTLVVFSILLTIILRARQRPTVTGMEELTTSTGDVISWSQGKGEVRVTGEIWSAAALSPEFIINAGDRVKVVAVEGLTLIVQPV